MGRDQAIADVAEKFFRAIEAGDIETVAGCYADDVRIWHNYTDVVSTKQENIEVLRGFIARSASRSYEERDLQTFPGGFVQQHRLVARAPDGYVLELPACLVCEVENGRIVSLREYFDPAALPEWFERTEHLTRSDT